MMSRWTDLAKTMMPALAAALVACSSTTEPAPQTVDVDPTVPVVPTGATLTVRWSLRGSLDPNECAMSGARQIQVTVLDPEGAEVGAYRQDCTTFATSIPLEAGTYVGRAVLLDAEGQLATTAVPLEQLTLLNGDDLVIAVDFPEDAFLP